jgi:hypothetical protein
MTQHRLARTATILTGAAFAVACGDSTAPELGAELDTDAAVADYEALDAALGSTDLLGFRALGDRTPFGGAPAAIDLFAGLATADRRGDGRAFALELFRRIEAGGALDRPAAAPIISDTHRGATFVYDPQTDRYVVDPDRAGAPSTGVRFVIYEVDGSGTPILDRERGWADLIDEGDDGPADVELRLVVVDGGTTVLEYATTLDVNTDRGLLTVRGYLHGDGVRLDFDIEAVGTSVAGTQTLDVAFDLGVDTRDFGIVGSVSGIEEGSDGEGEIDVTVRHGDDSLRVDVRGEAGILDGTVYLNGDIFATVAGAEEDPTFSGVDGAPLRFGELLVLRHIFDAIEDVFDFLEDLVDPVDALIVLGIIL